MLNYPQNDDQDTNVQNNAQSSLIMDDDFDRDIRKGFVRKVLGIVSMQMALTLSMAVYSSYNDEFGKLVRHWAVILLSLILMFTSLTSILCLNLTKVVPVNYFLLGLFTLSESIIVSHTTSYYETESVILAIVVLVIVTVCLWFSSMCMTSSE